MFCTHPIINDHISFQFPFYFLVAIAVPYLDCTRQTDRRTHLVLVEPLDDLVALVDDGLLVVVADLVLELLVLDGALHVEGVALQAVLGGDAVALLLVLRLVLVGVAHHPLDLLLRQATWNRHAKTNGQLRVRL